MDAKKPQHLEALDKANEVRLAAAAVKKEVRTGRLSVAEALVDPRAESVKVIDLLVCQRRWGRVKAMKTLQLERIPETRRVGDLTARQRTALASGLNVTLRVAFSNDQLILLGSHLASGVPEEGHAPAASTPARALVPARV